MIRKVNILACCLLLGALLLTACHDYDCFDDKEIGLSQAERLANADSLYLNLSIVGNSIPATRASETEENAIYDGILAFFVGNSETNAILKNATVIDQLINNPNEPRPTILSGSSTIDIVQCLPIGTHPYPESGTGKIYVLVLLNTTSTGFSVSNNMLYLNGTSLYGKKRDEIQSMLISSIGSPDEHVGLYMTNKPKDNGQVIIQVYDPDWAVSDECYLYDSEEAISQSTSTKKQLSINVERAAAKVSVANNVSTVSPISLNGDGSRHPVVHKMSWALNNFYSRCYAIRGGSGGTLTTNSFRAADFNVYHQQSYPSGETTYIAEGSSDVIVEVQLKDGSFLLDDCYQFNNTDDLYTSPVQLINHIKTNWWPTNKPAALSSANVDEVFKNTKIEIASNGNVTFTLTSTDLSQTELNSLANTLSGITKGFRDGKMYYTYSISSIQRNNAYNLTLQTSSITGIGRPTP